MVLVPFDGARRAPLSGRKNSEGTFLVPLIWRSRWAPEREANGPFPGPRRLRRWLSRPPAARGPSGTSWAPCWARKRPASGRYGDGLVAQLAAVLVRGPWRAQQRDATGAPCRVLRTHYVAGFSTRVKSLRCRVVVLKLEANRSRWAGRGRGRFLSRYVRCGRLSAWISSKEIQRQPDVHCRCNSGLAEGHFAARLLVLQRDLKWSLFRGYGRQNLVHMHS